MTKHNPLKKISVNDLVIGMHVKEFCASWIDSPFWRKGFMIADKNEIEILKNSAVKEVVIDTSKGLDCHQEPTQERPRTPPPAMPVKEPIAEPHVPIEEELKRATMLCAQSKRAVTAMFEEVRMGKAVDSGAAQQLVEDITSSITRNPGALISLARLKTADDYTYMHSVAVCAMMIALAKQLGLDEKETRLCGVSGLMHDLGKVSMPMDILNKPGKLTDDEFTVIRGHPLEGYKLLLNARDTPEMVLDVCLHHHEKIDGTGYPYGLTGNQISLHAKMGAICDVYDAITSNRPYKNGWDPAESIQKMAQWSTGHFDPTIFQAFVKSIGIYPVGSLVRMASGRLGIVTDQTEKSLTSPIVKVFFSLKSGLRINPVIVDLSKPTANDKILSREDPSAWKFSFLNELWSGGVAK